VRTTLRVFLTITFIAVGSLHFTHTEAFLAIMPAYLGYHEFWVGFTGVAEIAGGVGLIVPATRRWAGWGLLALLVGVFPANVNMAVHQITPPGFTAGPPWVLWARLPVQPLLMVAVWWVALTPAQSEAPPPGR